MDLQEAITARDKFLAEHPHLVATQKKIDEILDKCRPEDRFDVIMMLLAENLQKQAEALNILQTILIEEAK
jgi:hypothetical protein